MDKNEYSITFACYNAVHYTQKCVESMEQTGTPLDRVVVVDNGSTDATRELMLSRPFGGVIFNRQNLGCGVAWNQGAWHQQAEWTIVMNNDVLVSDGWIESLIETAERRGLKIISPAMIEGIDDYDFSGFSKAASEKMHDVIRLGHAHAVCMAIHSSVWMKIGYFYSQPTLWGYEDTLFFHAAKKAGIPMGITGASWLHHFGSITQSEMKKERGLAESAGLGKRDNYKLLHLSWFRRKMNKWEKVRSTKAAQEQEMAAYQCTIHGVRKDGHFLWL